MLLDLTLEPALNLKIETFYHDSRIQQCRANNFRVLLLPSTGSAASAALAESGDGNLT